MRDGKSSGMVFRVVVRFQGVENKNGIKIILSFEPCSWTHTLLSLLYAAQVTMHRRITPYASHPYTAT